MSKLENAYQSRLIEIITEWDPGIFCWPLDGNYRQGTPDILILYGNKWAMLEVKESAYAEHQPNQDTYVDIFNYMSFARFIYPENEQEVLHELYAFLGI